MVVTGARFTVVAAITKEEIGNKIICFHRKEINMKFDVVFFEREFDKGLSKIEIDNLLNICKGDEVIPLEIQGEYSVAMGFISLDMAESMNYVYDDLEWDVKQILDDMDRETEDHIYEYDIYKMFLDR